MSKVFNMVGGGGKNISSIIITGLTSTDTVTCTKDGKSYPATWDETAQHWEIVGLPLGTFTLTATRDSENITETVLIDIAGVYEIEMGFKLWLYRPGDECEDITGGYTIVTAHNTGFSKTDTCLSVSGGSRGNSNIYTNNNLDISGFSSLNFDMELHMSAHQWNSAGVGAVASNNVDTFLLGKDYAINTAHDISRTIVSFPITSVSGINSCKIKAWLNYETSDVSFKIYKIWLE